jgi:hypothetical protein
VTGNRLTISTVHLKYQIKNPTISGRVKVSYGHLDTLVMLHDCIEIAAIESFPALDLWPFMPCI